MVVCGVVVCGVDVGGVVVCGAEVGGLVVRPGGLVGGAAGGSYTYMGTATGTGIGAGAGAVAAVGAAALGCAGAGVGGGDVATGTPTTCDTATVCTRAARTGAVGVRVGVEGGTGASGAVPGAGDAVGDTTTIGRVPALVEVVKVTTVASAAAPVPTLSVAANAKATVLRGSMIFSVPGTLLSEGKGPSKSRSR